MTPFEMTERATRFALRTMQMADALARTAAGKTISHQVVRSACSVAANYRAAQRVRSRADFSNKIGIVLEEADESAFWIELAERSQLLSSARLEPLKKEAEELVRIFASMRRTAKNRG